MTQSVQERRRHSRREILDSFSIFVVIPTKGSHRLKVYDLSESGLGFDFDLPGENQEDSPLLLGDRFEIQLYLNQTLSIPLQVKVANIRFEQLRRRVGAEFMLDASQGGGALASFLRFVDEVSRLGETLTK